VIRTLAGSVWVRVAVTVAVLALLLSRIDVGSTLAALARLDLRLAVIVAALVFIDRGIMIWRWLLLLRARGVSISTGSATSIFLVSSFVGTSTAFAGDAARAYSLSRRTVEGSEAVASVAIDRVLGLLGIVAVGLAGFALAGARQTERSEVAFATTALVIVLASVVALFADRWIRRALPVTWHQRRLGGRVLRLADALSAYRGHRATLIAVTVLSVAVQLVRIFEAYLLGVGIGIDVPFSYYLLFMPAGLIALMLPISVAGFGAPQGLIVWLLQPRGVPVADALALSTLIVLSGLLGNLPGAVLSVWGRR
jgi:uncharacterized protein (TIRG00374 family)